MMLVASASEAQGTHKITIVKPLNFTVYEKNSRLYIDWSIDDSTAANYFEVQKSNDRKEFRTVAIVLGPDPRKREDEYGYSEKIKAAKDNKIVYWRLRHIDTKGHEELSEIIEQTK